MAMSRLSNGVKIAACSAIFLFAFMFLKWYGVGTTERPNLLIDLRLLEDGGNAWETLKVTPFFLALVIAVAVGVAAWQVIVPSWRPLVSPGAVVCGLGALAASLILMRIVFPPDLGGEVEGFTFEATVEVGIFLALAAACGIAYGGRRAMREEGVFFTDLRLRRHRNRGRHT